jgi:ATP-dependent nuclease subunit A
MEEFYVLEFYSTNSDIKNIFKFFNTLKEHNDLFEFVTYVEDEKEKLKQLSSGDEEAINLMTIHKSKGLEFDTVIYYENDTGITRENRDLIIYFDYDEKFEKVNNFLITFPKYNKIFIDGDYFRINEKNRKKEEMENINNDYVALTRAKKNLLLFMEAYIIKDKNKESFKDSFIKRLIEIYNDEEYYSIGEITESRKERGKTPIREYKEIDSIMSYFDDDILKKPVNNYKTDLEGEFRRKKGLAMHYYFEHMTNDYENDRKNAKSAFLSRYGNMLGKKLIEELLERMEKFILENKEIYDRKYKVYTEFEIYDRENNKRIIDRINIDEENGKIFIYDYKTGFEPTENKKYIQQLEEYKKILAEKTSGKYEIFTKILEV